MPRKKLQSTSIEKALASKLQAEVDLAVLRVREAADKAVQAFEDYAVRIATGEAQVFTAAPEAKAYFAGSTGNSPVERGEQLPAHMRPPEDEGMPMPTTTVTDSAAQHANLYGFR